MFKIDKLLHLPATLVNVILVASKAKYRGWFYWLSGYFNVTGDEVKGTF